jgi:hypothetical protein
VAVSRVWGARPASGSDEDDVVRQAGGYPPPLWMVSIVISVVALVVALTSMAVTAGVFDDPTSRAAGYSDGLRGMDCAEQAHTGAPLLRWDNLDLRAWLHGCQLARREHPDVLPTAPGPARPDARPGAVGPSA